MTRQYRLEERLAETPVMDIHTHLIGGQLGAQGLHDLLLYHMVVSDLYAAGCPSGARLTQFPRSPTPQECSQRVEEALPYLPRIQNTSSAWVLRMILADLYDWTEPVTPSNWRVLDGRIRERSSDRAWHHSILDRLRIRRSGTELARRGNGRDDPRLQYALEWGFFTRCQWGEYDTALYELERCWGRSPESPTPIGSGSRAPIDRPIRSLEDVHEAVSSYVQAIPADRVLATATHISTDIDYGRPSKSQMETALRKRREASPKERDIYASYINELLLSEMEQRTPGIVFQFSLGAEPLPYETCSRLEQKTIAQLADMIQRHKGLRFQCFLSSRHANQSLCTLARELPNLSLAGIWWHNFFPDTMRQVLGERLDMVPSNKQVAFFSDAYCLEWTYGKLQLFRKQLARVLTERLEQGQYGEEDAVRIANQVLYESPQQLLGMQPHAA